jgi:hypothetical protein
VNGTRGLVKPPTLSPGDEAMQRIRVRFLALLALGAAACGGGETGGETAAVRPPASSGTVLVMDNAARGTAGAVVGFVNGLHTVVLDGDRVYAGMTRIDTTAAPDGARGLALAGGLTAQLVQSGDAYEIRFSSGETIQLRAETRGSN